MSIFPSVNTSLQAQIDATTSTTSSTITSLGKSYAFDFDTGDFITKDGKLVVATDLEALKIWIRKVLKTEKFNFKIYKKEDTIMEYGITLMDLIISNNYPLSYLKSEIQREIEEALLKNTLIKSISNWVFNRNKLILSFSFTVNLTNGAAITEEVSL